MPSGTREAIQPDLVQLAEFLRLLHGSKPPGHYFYTWHLDSKQTMWHTDVEAAIDHFHSVPVSKLTNLYTGVAWSPISKGSGQRVRTTEVSGCSSTWLDLDVQDTGAHKKPNLPPDTDTANNLVQSWAPCPSMEVFSGHGLQHWWRFDEPWIVQDDSDRKRLQTLIQGWQVAITQLFAAHGWQVDATHDLARVMRIPGTINVKAGCEPVLAQLITARSDITYDPMALMSRIEQTPGLAIQLTSQTVAAVEGQIDYDALFVDPKADVGNAKLEALFEIDPKVRQIWLRKWKGGFDESKSGWDASLASRVAMTGVWSPQEIVTLLKVYRQKYKCDDVPDTYYRTTVKNAFQFVSGSEAQVKINELANEITSAEDLLDHQREDVIAAVKERLGVRIDRIRKFGEHPVRYVFTVNSVDSAPITTRGVLSYKSVEEAIFDAANQNPPSLKLEQWRPIIKLLTFLIEEQPVDPEMSPGAQAGLWVEEYLGRRQIVEDPQEALRGPSVLEKEGALYILSSDFRSWLTIEHREVKYADITRGLLDLQASPETVRLNRKSSMARTFFRLPDRFRDRDWDAEHPGEASDDDSSLI